MPVSARTLQALMAAGIEGAALLEIVGFIDADMALGGASSGADEQAERRRERDRERSRVRRRSADGPQTPVAANPQTIRRQSADNPQILPPLARVEDNLLRLVDTGKKEERTKILVAIPDFEDAWRAYPHRRGRSSKPKSLAAWKALSVPHRVGMLKAVQRYALEGLEPKADCGAKAFELWLRDQRFLDWMDDGPEAPRELSQAEKDAHDAKILGATNALAAEIARNSHLPPAQRNGGGLRPGFRG